MDDNKLFVEITYDDKSADVTVVLFRDRFPLPVSSEVARFDLDLSEPPSDGLKGVRDLLVAVAEYL